MNDIHYNTALAQVERITKTADFDGATIDGNASNGQMIIVDVGEVGTAGGALDASNKWDLKLYTAPDVDGSPGDWAVAPESTMRRDITTATTTGIFATIDAADEDEQPYRVSYTGPNRFRRVRYEATGSPGSTDFVTSTLTLPYYVAPAE